MAQAHLIWIYDDALSIAQEDFGDDHHIVMQIGEGILALCTSGKNRSDNKRTYRYAPLAFHGNGINWNGLVKGSEEIVFGWINNRLAPIETLRDEEFDAIEQLVKKERKRRKDVHGGK